MSRRPTPLLIVFLVLASTGLSGCAELSQVLQNIPRPSARVEGARIEGFSFDSLTLALDLRIDNPLDVDVPMMDVALRLASRGATLVTGDFPLQGFVPARSYEQVTVPVQVNLIETLRTLSDIRPGQVVDYRAEMELALDVPVTGRVSLPLSHEGGLPIPAPPTVTVDAFQWDELSLQRVSGSVDLRLGNPNEFAVGFDAIDLGLELAGRRVGGLDVNEAPTLGAGTEGTLEIPLSLSPIDLGTAVFDVLRGNEARYGLSGALAVSTPFGPLRVPVDAIGDAVIRRTR